MIKDIYLNNGKISLFNIHFITNNKKNLSPLSFKYWLLRVLNMSMIKYEYEYVKYVHEYDKVGNMRREESKER